MARIRNTRTKPEMYIRSELHRNGFRFRVNYSVVTGKPDIYFTKKKIALFVHGCFWHQHHGCRYCTIPKSNIEYWLPKLERNLIRDQKVLRELTGQGIKVIIIWECAIKHMKRDIEFHGAMLNEITEYLSNPIWTRSSVWTSDDLGKPRIT